MYKSIFYTQILFLLCLHKSQCFKINSISKSAANDFLTKNRLARNIRSNSDYFEEMRANNFERECLEERCDNDELVEAVETLREDSVKLESNLFQNMTFQQIYDEKFLQIYNSCYFRLKNGLEICDKIGTKECINGYASYTCVCKKDFEGKNCEKFVGVISTTKLVTTTTPKIVTVTTTPKIVTTTPEIVTTTTSQTTTTTSETTTTTQAIRTTTSPTTIITTTTRPTKILTCHYQDQEKHFCQNYMKTDLCGFIHFCNYDRVA